MNMHMSVYIHIYVYELLFILAFMCTNVSTSKPSPFAMACLTAFQLCETAVYSLEAVLWIVNAILFHVVPSSLGT